MLSRPLGAILAVFVGVAAASAQSVQSVPPPVLSPDAFPPVGDAYPVDAGVYPGWDGGGPEPYRWWLSAEYLLGFTKPADVPPLVSSGSVTSGGVLGQAGATTLFGGKQDFDGISGARFGGGVWLDSCRAYGLDWSVFFLPTQRNSATFGAGSGVLARPFFDTALNTENSRLLASPGLFTGAASTTFSTLFWGAEVGGVLRVVETPTYSFEQLFHFRYFALEESLRVDDNSTALGGGVVAFNGTTFPNPATVSTTDYYSVINRWYGGSAGIRFVWTPGRWDVRLAGRLGVGATQQNINLSGSTTLSGVGPSTSVAPGFLTASQSQVAFTNYKFSLAPDVQLKVGYRLTDWLMVSAGYQFLYITDVARAPDLVNRRVHPGLIPSSQTFGAAAPPVPGFPTVRSTDYYMHGLMAGLMLTF